MRRVLALSMMAMIVVMVAACGGGADAPAAPAASKGDATKGKAVFLGTCAACHGTNAKGMPGLGKDMTTSKFISGLNDDLLLDFVKKGRPSSDPANTTHVDMPPKGGNPALGDEDLYNVIAYIRTLNK